MTRLLVVDDIAENRNILARRFARQGFEVAEADNGMAALEMIAQSSFDAVLLDIVMPKLDGIEVLRRIRTDHSPAGLPVIMVTAKTEATDVVEALELGANDYITKPVDFPVALARVQTQLARKHEEAALRQANEDLAQQVRALEISQQAAEQARVRAENASRAKTEFLAVMSHEIRTPLNSILGYAELVLEEVPLEAEQRRYVERIGIAGSALLTVVSDVLDVSRIEAGEVELKREPFSLPQLLADAVAVVRPMADRQALRVHIQHDERLRQVTGPADRLRQILINLLDNAVKFTGEGSIQLKARCLSEDEFGYLVRFSVADTGAGIPSDKQDRLMRALSRADGWVARKPGAIGLGLALSSRLVRLLGGQIGFESTPGRGSTFWFEVKLPRPFEVGRSDIAMQASPPRQSPNSDGRPAECVDFAEGIDESRGDWREAVFEQEGGELAACYAGLVDAGKDLLARAFELEREVRRCIPPIPDALLARPADAELSLPQPLKHANGRLWFGYEQAEILRGRLLLQPEHGQEPGQQARMEEIVAAWDQWRLDVEWVRRRVGLTALNQEIERNAQARRDLLARIALSAVDQGIGGQP